MAGQVTGEFAKLRVATRIEQEAEALLRKYNVEPREPIIAEKKPPGTIGTVPETVVTNMFGMVLPQIPVYRYDVRIVGNSRRQKPDGTVREASLELSKGTKENVLAIEFKNMCRDVFKQLLQANRAMFQDGAIYYDLQAILYSIKDLKIQTSQQFRLPSASWNSFKFDEITVELSTVTEGFQLNIGDIATAIPQNLENVDHSLIQFLELATSQHALLNPNEHVCFPGGKSYLMDPMAHGFQQNDTPLLSDHVYLAVGAHKSARPVEGPRGRGGLNVALVVESKKTPFHSSKPLLDVARSVVQNIDCVRNGDVQCLVNEFKGLWVQAAHTWRFYRIRGICEKNAVQVTFPASDGSKTNVFDYFKKQYDITLEHPQAPLVESCGRDRKDKIYLPIEILHLCDNQRVATQHQSPNMLRTMIRACAVPPAQLREQNQRNAQALHLDDPSLTANGIQITAQPVQVEARVLPPPPLSYAQNRNVLPDASRNYTWRGNTFVKPASCDRWACVWISSGNSDRISTSQITQFVNRFMEMARNRGMTLQAPVINGQVATRQEKLEECMKAAKAQNIRYMLFVHSDQDDTLHAWMKKYECELEIITQGVRVSTVLDVVNKGRPQTVENIVNKANVKLGGLNYSLNISDQKAQFVLGQNILYIGFGMDHPAGGLGMNDDASEAGEGNAGPPSIIGYAANTCRHPFEFVGDFRLQESRRDEKLDVLVDIVKTCVEKFQRNRGALPQHVILYRNGCSDGQFAKVIKFEVPLIYAALQQKNCGAKLTVLVPNKLHNVRLFKKDIPKGARPPEQNIKPGTIVDQVVVHPTNNEFYLNSHVALQGTAKSPRYTVLVDDNNFSSDKLQLMTYWLCYGHQIVNLPTSLPSPVYIALEYAKRGRAVFNSHSAQSTSSDSNGDPSEHWRRFESRYCYASRLLGDLRTNA